MKNLFLIFVILNCYIIDAQVIQQTIGGVELVRLSDVFLFKQEYKIDSTQNPLEKLGPDILYKYSVYKTEKFATYGTLSDISGGDLISAYKKSNEGTFSDTININKDSWSVKHGSFFTRENGLLANVLTVSKNDWSIRQQYSSYSEVSFSLVSVEILLLGILFGILIYLMFFLKIETDQWFEDGRIRNSIISILLVMFLLEFIAHTSGHNVMIKYFFIAGVSFVIMFFIALGFASKTEISIIFIFLAIVLPVIVMLLSYGYMVYRHFPILETIIYFLSVSGVSFIGSVLYQKFKNSVDNFFVKTFAKFTN